MPTFAEKVQLGAVTDEDWNAFLQQAHRLAPSMTPAGFSHYKNASGLTSYEVLADEVAKQTPLHVLDLACGDGALFPYLLRKLPAEAKITGIDMSEGELAVAKENFELEKQIELHLANAGALPLKDASVDAIACHMAFMLMLPLDPVVSEIQRVLKPGGRFTSVIGNSRGKEGLVGEINKRTWDFVSSRYPKILEVRFGDSRVQSDEGLRKLLSAFQSGSLEFTDIALSRNTDVQGVWELMKDMYVVSMLPEADKKVLETELNAFALTRLGTDGRLRIDFQMKMFSVSKPAI